MEKCASQVGKMTHRLTFRRPINRMRLVSHSQQSQYRKILNYKNNHLSVFHFSDHDWGIAIGYIKDISCEFLGETELTFFKVLAIGFFEGSLDLSSGFMTITRLSASSNKVPMIQP